MVRSHSALMLLALLLPACAGDLPSGPSDDALATSTQEGGSLAQIDTGLLPVDDSGGPPWPVCAETTGEAR
ncbi:MAG: hypothetical protein JRH20_14330, partial [Deltaproteobacteria bacterium]|nr:hypothetical protein [Deltaproteobacteria bacterium]